MICKNCGKENFDTRATCMYCNQKLDNAMTKDENKVSKYPINQMDNKDFKVAEDSISKPHNKIGTALTIIKGLLVISVLMLIFLFIYGFIISDQGNWFSAIIWTGFFLLVFSFLYLIFSSYDRIIMKTKKNNFLIKFIIPVLILILIIFCIDCYFVFVVFKWEEEFSLFDELFVYNLDQLLYSSIIAVPFWAIFLYLYSKLLKTKK